MTTFTTTPGTRYASAALPAAAMTPQIALAAARHDGPLLRPPPPFQLLARSRSRRFLLAPHRADEIHTIFGLNVSDEEFARVSEENFIPADRAQFLFHPDPRQYRVRIDPL